MKTKLSWIAVWAVWAVAGHAGAAEKPHACCASPAPAALALLSDRSIYQLDANWTNDAGEVTTLASLRGRPVVLAMFFANCSYACPILVNDMMRIRDALPAGTQQATQFVLVSFDSVRDTPAALRAYRERTGLDSQWSLLRGDYDAVQELAMLLGVKYKRDARGDYAHSNVITVLNPGGEVAHRLEGLKQEIAAIARAVEITAP